MELNDDISRALSELNGGTRSDASGAEDGIAYGLAADLTNSTGFSDADLSGDGGMIPHGLADDLEDFQDQVARRDEHLSWEYDEDGEAIKPAVQNEALQQQRQQFDEQAQQLEAQRQHMAAVQMQQLQLQRAQLEQQRWAQLEAQIPAFEEDPEGNINGRFALEQLRQQEAQQAEQYRQQFQRQTQEFSRHAAEVAPVVQGIEAEYIEQHLGGDEAAYRGAFDHLFAHADQQIKQQYPGLDEQGYATMRSMAAMAFLKNCSDQGVNPAEYVYGRARELGYRANGRVPHNHQRQPATMEQLANMSDKQFKQAMKQPKPQRVQPVVDVDRMSDADFDKMFAEMAGSNNALAFFGD